jgi:hypothetical protein
MRKWINIVDGVEVEISLQRAPDDPRIYEPVFQVELKDFSKSLRAAGVAFSQQSRTVTQFLECLDICI